MSTFSCFKNLFCVFSVLIACFVANASLAGEGDQHDSRRLAAVIGLQSWSEIDDVQPVLGGDFDDFGLNFEASYHRRAQQITSAPVFWGINLGFFSHDSDIRGVEENEDLQASAVYIGPSLKWAFHDSTRTRWFLDGGVAYYWISIDEYEDSCYFDCDVYEYYDDNNFGAFVGVSTDINFAASDRYVATAGLKVHFVDFDAPTLLDNSTDLDGEIYQLQFGIAFGR